MFTAMTSASRINGYLFVFLLLAMFFYSAPKLISYIYKNVNSVESLTNGKIMRRFEQQYDKEIFLRDPSIEIWSLVQYALFKEGRVGVVSGKNGWLFTKEEYPQVYAIERQLNETLQQIIAVKNRLIDKALVVMPVPMKNDIYGEYNTLHQVDVIHSLYSEFITQLRENGINTISLRESFLENKDLTQLYFKTDTHWTPEGAQLAAENIAKQKPELIGETTFVTDKGTLTIMDGDLLNYFGLSDLTSISHIEQEQYQPYSTYKADNGSSGVDLFGDSTESIVLVGTSYTEMEPWNFPGFVQQALKQDIITIANEAKGPFASMQEFTESELLQDSNIKHVIWEFPIRTILQQ